MTDLPLSDARIEALVDLYLTPRPSEPTPRDIELAATGRRLSLKAGLATWAWEPADDRQIGTVLLVHGWESRATHWGGFIKPFADAGYRVVAIDAPAHGESPGVQTNGLIYGKKLVEIGEELGPFAGIIAHSFGVAAVVIGLERGLRADSAVLIAGPSTLSAFTEEWSKKKGITEADLPRFNKAIDDRIGVPVESFDIPRIAKHLNVRALIIHDRDDQEIALEKAEANARAWPGSTLLITEKLGHRRILISRRVVQAALAFVKSRGHS